ncbi:MAG: nucleotidyltransferase family protein [Phycisphaerales bacterium]
MILNGVTIPEQKIAEFSQRHGIARLAFFGSVLTDQFTAESDIDVLVDFFPDRVPGLFEFESMRDELTTLLGRTVDLRTPAFLSRYFRDEVIRHAKVAYAA